MSEINVIYQFNEKYAPFAGVSMTSLLINNAAENDVNIYVLGEGLSGESVEKLKRLTKEYGARIVFPDTEDLLKKFKDMGMIPYRGAYSVYLRLFFTELLDLAGKRAVYIDADSIVDKSLAPLVEYDLGGKSIGMVLESIRDDYKVMIGMPKSSDYYNSGMILFDVDKWIANRYCERIVDHIRNVRSSYIGDQDFLNIVCDGDVCRLPLVYNYQPLHGRYSARQYFGAYPLTGSDDEYYRADEIEAARHDAVILHCYRWLGEFPWNKGNLHPFNDLFDEYLAQSPWKGYVKKKHRLAIAMKIEKIMYILLPKWFVIRAFKHAHELMLRRAESDARRMKTNASA